MRCISAQCVWSCGDVFACALVALSVLCTPIMHAVVHVLAYIPISVVHVILATFLHSKRPVPRLLVAFLALGRFVSQTSVLLKCSCLAV